MSFSPVPLARAVVTTTSVSRQAEENDADT
jgi:hypothetical protein